MIPFDIGDPANPNSPYSQQTPVTLPGSTAKLLALNDTPYQILLQFSGSNGARLKVPSGWARIFPVAANAQQVMWTIDKSLAPLSALISDLTLEAYQLGEELPSMYPIVRQISGSSTVIANELGTTAEGVTTQFSGGVIDVLLPYSTTPNVQRDIEIDTLANGGAHFRNVRFSGLDGSTEVFGYLTVDATKGITGQGLFVTGGMSTDNGQIQSVGAGLLSTYGGVATAGQGVVPVRASLEPPVTVTAITLQNVLSITPANNGLYMACLRVRLNNGTSGQLITARVAYTDPDTLATPSFPFQFGNSAGVYQVAAGAVSFTNQVWDSQPLFFRAKGGSAITLQYTDPANTPNDQVSGAIIQIA